MQYDCYKPIRTLPEEIRCLFQADASRLFEDLRTHRNEFVRLPQYRPPQKCQGHKTRCFQSQNPDWYSELYHAHLHFRRDRSLKALERIVKCEDKKYVELRHCAKSSVLEERIDKKGKKKVCKRPFVPCKYGYDSLYRDFIFRRLTEGYKFENWQAPADESAVAYFAGRFKENEVPF